jgi:uncharacterized protein YbbC (DUF1343 family)
MRVVDLPTLAGRNIGLVTHPAAVDADRISTLTHFRRATTCTLAAIFGPEHGITGEAQDLIPVMGETQSTIPVHSLYGDTFDTLKPTAAMLRGLDTLVIDMVDIGSRYYTFQATMLYCLEACAEVGVSVVVLDRPNPLGRTVEGPTIQPGFESFVGPHPIATRHGLTMGELALLYRRERVPNVDLTIVPPDEPNTLWFPPSPNMPTLDTAIVYPGMCLIEGTNLSEGRGTTRPFEFVGFPGVNAHQLAERLNRDELPGVDFLPITFRPTFQKHVGQSCGGVFVVPTNREQFRPVRTGLAVVIAFRDLLGERFCWRTERYEFVDHIPAIDLLFGSARERTLIDAGARWADIAPHWDADERAFAERRV